MTSNKILKLTGSEQPFEKEDRKKRRIHISGATHIGRAGTIEWATERERPEAFAKLDVLLQVPGGLVSRNHCGIIPINEAHTEKRKTSGYGITDLNSRNGTTLQSMGPDGTLGEILKVPTNRFFPLHEGDLIGLSTGYYLKVSIDGATTNTAITLGNEQYNPISVEKSLNSLTDELTRHGFGKDAYRCDGTNGKQAILSTLERAAYQATIGSTTVFTYCGPSTEQGIIVGQDIITPEELDSRLFNIRGKKVVIMDTQYGIVFKRHARVLAPNSLELISIHDPTDESQTIVPQGKYIGSFCDALASCFKTHGCSVELTTLKSILENTVAGTRHSLRYQSPLERNSRAGSILSICEDNHLNKTQRITPGKAYKLDEKKK